MTITITYGYWLLPLISTIGVLGIWYIFIYDRSPCYSYACAGQALMNLLTLAVCTLVCAVAWLIYTTLT